MTEFVGDTIYALDLCPCAWRCYWSDGHKHRWQHGDNREQSLPCQHSDLSGVDDSLVITGGATLISVTLADWMRATATYAHRGDPHDE